MLQSDSVFHFTALSTSLFYKKAPSVVDKARSEVQKALQKGKTLGKWMLENCSFWFSFGMIDLFIVTEWWRWNSSQKYEKNMIQFVFRCKEVHQGLLCKAKIWEIREKGTHKEDTFHDLYITWIVIYSI